MKIIFGSFLLLSGIFSAQTSLLGLNDTDSIAISKIYTPLIVGSYKADSLDTAIAKLYKMPVAKPKDSEIYSSLKAPEKNNSQFKILNPLDSLKNKKLATK